MRPIVRIVIHHAASVSTASAESIRKFQVEQRNFSDIAYHYVIEQHHVRLGRPNWIKGAHAKNYNTGSIGVCLVGDHTKRPPTERQRSMVLHLVADLIGWHGLGTDHVFGHNELPGTTPTLCPAMDMDLFRSDLERILSERAVRWGKHARPTL